MFHTTLSYSVPSAAAGACKDGIEELVAHVDENEPHTLRYTVLVDSRGEKVRFLHLGVFESQEALRQHRGSEAMDRFLELVEPLATGSVQFSALNVLKESESGSQGGRL